MHRITDINSMLLRLRLSIISITVDSTHHNFSPVVCPEAVGRWYVVSRIPVADNSSSIDVLQAGICQPTPQCRQRCCKHQASGDTQYIDK